MEVTQGLNVEIEQLDRILVSVHCITLMVLTLRTKEGCKRQMATFPQPLSFWLYSTVIKNSIVIGMWQTGELNVLLNLIHFNLMIYLRVLVLKESLSLLRY